MDQEGAAKNREIEKTIKADQKKAAREVKLLLLGEQTKTAPIPSFGQFNKFRPQLGHKSHSLPTSLSFSRVAAANSGV